MSEDIVSDLRERLEEWKRHGAIVSRGENMILFPKERTDNVHAWSSPPVDMHFAHGSTFIPGGVVTAENCAAFNRSDDVVEVVLNVHFDPDAPALFVLRGKKLRAIARADALRLARGWKRLPEIRARAEISRYWAQRLRWLRKRGRA